MIGKYEYIFTRIQRGGIRPSCFLPPKESPTKNLRFCECIHAGLPLHLLLRSFEWMCLRIPIVPTSALPSPLFLPHRRIDIQGARARGQGKNNSQHIIIQTDNVRIAEKQKEILQRLGQPKTFHLVQEEGLLGRYITDGRGAVFACRVLINSFEHLPALFTPIGVASHTIHDKDGFYSFGPVVGELILVVGTRG